MSKSMNRRDVMDVGIEIASRKFASRKSDLLKRSHKWDRRTTRLHAFKILKQKVILQSSKIND